MCAFCWCRPNLHGLYFAPDRSVALARQAVLVLDGTSGRELALRELARHGDLAKPTAIAFGEAR